MNAAETLLLNRDCIASVLSLPEVTDAVEQAFLSHSRGQVLRPGLLHIDAADGEFHIKAGGLVGDRTWFAIKANAGFFGNEKRFGLPNILGVILLFDGETGRLISCMDSGHITALRTGAATAIAAKLIASRASRFVTICGCGRQGRIQLEALRFVLPGISHVALYDIRPDAASALAASLSSELTATVVDEASLDSALHRSDIVVACTPSKRFYIPQGAISPGTFIAAIGADSPEKHELDPELLAQHTVVVDVLEQCATVGELHHAIERGLMTEQDVLGTLGDLLSGKTPGRTSPEEIIVFDATGTALQDVAAARVAYERALEKGLGVSVRL